MEEYKELIKKAAKTRKQLQITYILMMIALPIATLFVSWMLMVYEEPTNLNIFMLCALWGVMGIFVITVYKALKEL